MGKTEKQKQSRFHTSQTERGVIRMKKRKESKKGTKKQVTLCGSLLGPLAIGQPAVFSSGGAVYRTSRVAAIHGMTAEEVRFETVNTQYRLIRNTYPIAAMVPMAQPMCCA